MADDDAHSLLNASGSDGWTVCAGKIAMEKGRRRSSEYADEGTAAHTLASWVMENRIEGGELTAEDFLGRQIDVKTFDETTEKWVTRTYTVDQEMAEHVDYYVDRVMLLANAKGSARFCEVRVHYHEYLGVQKKLAWGTSDGVMILFDQPELEWNGRIYPAGDELQVHDLKFGKGVRVFADTRQAKLYAVGALWEFDHLADIKRVRVFIHQPRMEHEDELVLTVEELLEEVAAMRPAVPRVLEALDLRQEAEESGSDLDPLALSAMLDGRGFLATSEKGCRFCDAKAFCTRLAADVGEAVSGRPIATIDDFDDLTVDGPAEVHEYGSNYLTQAYFMLDRVEQWSKAVRAEIERRVLLKGETFEGVKVVHGRRGRRSYRDQGAVEHFVRTKVPGPIRDLLYKQVLLTPAQAEKKLKTSPLWWQRLQEFIYTPEGKAAVVPVADRRKAISHRAAIDDFDDLTAEDEPTPAGGRAAGYVDRHPFR